MPDTPPSASITQHLRITGRVQGVWYRASMCTQAQALGVGGWVRNRGDGSVEAICQGTADRLEALRQWCLVGPPKARVEGVEVQVLPPPQAGFGDFVQRPTE